MVGIEYIESSVIDRAIIRCRRYVDNLKILDGGRPPCCIFIFAIRSLSYWKSNYEANTLNLVINVSYNRMKVIVNLQFQNCGRPTSWIFIVAIHSLICRKSNTEEPIKFGDSSCN